MRNNHLKLILLFLLFLPVLANAIADQADKNAIAPDSDQALDYHFQQLEAAFTAEVKFLQSITDEASVAGKENELFGIYQRQQKHQQAISKLIKDDSRSDASKNAFKRMMDIRLSVDNALMKELLRLKDNARIAALRTEAHEKSRADKKPALTLNDVLVMGKLTESDTLLLSTPEKILDQVNEDFAKWHDLEYQQQEYIAVRVSQVLQADNENARAYVELAQWHLKRGYIKNRFYEPEQFQKAKFCNDQAMKLEPTRVSAWSQKITLAKTFLDARTIQDTLNAYAADKEATFPEKADALLWLYDNNDDQGAYASLVKQLAEKVRKGVEKNDPEVKRYDLVMERIQEYFLRHNDLKSADQYFSWHRGWRNDHAWVLGNYAHERLKQTGDYETSITLLETALQKLNYGIGRHNLAFAYYVGYVMEKSKLDLLNAAKYKFKLLQSGYKEAEFIPDLGQFNHAPTVATIVDDFGKQGLALREERAGRTALHFAADNANLETARVLVERGADIQAFDDTENNAVFYAAKNNDVEMLRLFVGKGADVTKKAPQFGGTALHVAAGHGAIAAADFLLSHDADINASTKDRSTPLVNAMLSGHLDMAKFLVSRNADISISMMGDASLKDLANMGVDENIKNYIAELFADDKP